MSVRGSCRHSKHNANANVGYWHIASYRCGAEFGRYQGIADIDQAAPIKLDL
jgi:hypothetical protein